VAILGRRAELAGMGGLTKAFGIALGRVKRQYGATQWDSTSLRPGWKRPIPTPTRSFHWQDQAAIRALHARIEAGERLSLIDVTNPGPSQTLHLVAG